MNIQEIRQNYPQYSDLSDEQIATGMHKKYYSDIPFEDFSAKIGYTAQKRPEFSQEALEAVKANTTAYEEKNKNRSELKEGLQAMSGDDWLDVGKNALLGAEAIPQGLTLGGYGWLNDKLGGNYSERKKDFEDLAGTAGSVALAVPEIGANIVGPGAAIFKGMGKAGLKGSKLAASTGAVEGGGYGFTESRGDLADTAKGAAFGGALGAAVPFVANKVAGTVGDVAVNTGRKIEGLVKGKGSNVELARALSAARKAMGEESFNKMVRESNRTGRNLIESGDEKVQQLAKKAVANSSGAREILSKSSKELTETSGARSRAKIDEILGNKSRLDNAADIEAAYFKKASPMYEEAFTRHQDIPIKGSFAKDVLEDDVIKKALGSADYRYGIQSKEPGNSLRRFDAAKKWLDDEIASAKISGRNEEVRTLTMSKNKLVGHLDEISPEYKEARRLYADGAKLKNAQDTGYKFLDSKMKPAEFGRAVKNMTEPEKLAMDVGIRDKIIDILGSNENELMQLKKLIPDNTRKNLEAAMGGEKAKKLIDFAESELKAKRNFNSVLGQSQTAEMLRMQGEGLSALQKGLNRYGNLNIAAMPVQMGKDLVNTLINGARSNQYNAIAKALSESPGKGLQNSLNRAINMPSVKINNYIEKLLNPSAAVSGSVAGKWN